MAINTHRQMGISQTAQSKSMEKLSSGYRINRASDDAAGLSISEKMRGQINGLDQASRNAQDGISMIQTAEGALNETHSILQRMRELVVQGGSDTLDTNDIAAIQTEIDELSNEITSISANTEFNGIKLLDGTLTGAGAATIQVGANASQNLDITIGTAMSAAGLSVEPADLVVGSTNFATSIGNLDAAITTVSTTRSTIGAQQNRLEHTIANLNNGAENLQAAESRIRDVDMAKEMMEFTKNNILQQASQSMLAQANQAPQGVLQLLG
jgi:flagellin